MHQYVRALREEIRVAAQTLGDRRVTTIYIGGGTPTLMPSEDYQTILDQIGEVFEIADDAEITTEANPETLTMDHLVRIRATGVNRLSLGMQSSAPHVLTTLDRVHTPGRVAEAVDWARGAGFTNLSLDLIYGTPGESMADWRDSLRTAVDLAPEHVSAYSLIVEEGTGLARRMAAGQLPYPDEDDLADKYICADEILSTAGFQWYEVSNWSKPGYECRHNLAYWRCQPWWGIGAGAHSFIDHQRWWNHKRPETYIQALANTGSPIAGSEQLTADQAHTESVMLALRLREGIDKSVLTRQERGRALAYVQSGHLAHPGSRFVCTQAGRLIADGIVREILD